MEGALGGNGHGFKIFRTHHGAGAAASSRAAVADDGGIFYQIFAGGTDTGGAGIFTVLVNQPRLCFFSIFAPDFRSA